MPKFPHTDHLFKNSRLKSLIFSFDKMPKRSLNNSKARRTYHQHSDDEKSVQELDPRKENSISEHSMPDYAREEETEPSVIELDDDEEIEGSSKYWILTINF